MEKYDACIIANYTICKTVELNQRITNLQLQKILYFLWIDYYKSFSEKLFSNRIFAWQLGPVIADVYDIYKKYGNMKIDEYEQEKCYQIESSDRIFLDEKIEIYSNIPASKLVDMSHVKGGAWDKIYNELNGNGFIIPLGLIAQKGR